MTCSKTYNWTRLLVHLPIVSGYTPSMLNRTQIAPSKHFHKHCQRACLGFRSADDGDVASFQVHANGKPQPIGQAPKTHTHSQVGVNTTMPSNTNTPLPSRRCMDDTYASGNNTPQLLVRWNGGTGQTTFNTKVSLSWEWHLPRVRWLRFCALHGDTLLRWQMHQCFAKLLIDTIGISTINSLRGLKHPQQPKCGIFSKCISGSKMPGDHMKPAPRDITRLMAALTRLLTKPLHTKT
jgi:hypothetical protein